MALEAAASDLTKETVEEVPNHLRDKSYQGAKRMGHGEGYDYVHNHPEHYVKQEYIKRERDDITSPPRLDMKSCTKSN